jgi:hypothetical protein
MNLTRKILATTAVTGALIFGGAVAANAATSTTTAKTPATTATAKPATPSKANCPNM